MSESDVKVGELKMIPIAEIRENPVALRLVNRQSEEYQQMLGSVRKTGVINPIVVRRKATGKGDKADGKNYEIIDGLHRYTTSMEAGLSTIPANILDMTDAETYAAQIVGNFQKVETTPTQYTRGLVRILGLNPLMTQAELAAMLSVSPAFIDQRLSLTNLVKSIGQLVDSGRINLTNAFSLASLPQSEQPEWVERALTQQTGEFVQQVKARVKKLKEDRRAGRETSPEVFTPTPHMRAMSELKAAYFDGLAGKPTAADDIIRVNNIQTPREAFLMGVAWALMMDPEAQDAARKKDADRKQRDADAKALRDAERTTKKAQEAGQKQAELQKEAADARAKALARGVNPDAENNGAEAETEAELAPV